MKLNWQTSPNFQAMEGRPITCIVIHATATKSLASPLEWLCNPNSKVSAHYLVDVTGEVYALIEDYNIAWHAGRSEWKGEKGVNGFSLGIELVNANDGIMAYSPAQIDALTELCREKCELYKIKPEDVVGHLHVSPGRKTDPAGFDFDAFRKSLA